MLHSGKTTYYYSGGSDYELNHLTAASAYLVFYAMCDSLVKGYPLFDMGGVPVSPSVEHPAYGVFQFKQSYGGEYVEFTSGRFVIDKFKYKIVASILGNRTIMRMISKKM